MANTANSSICMWSKVIALASWVGIGLQKLTSIVKLMSTTDTQTTPKPRMKQMEALLETHKAVFQEGIGEINTFEATLQLKPSQIL